MTKQLNTPTQRGLGINGQFVGIIEDNAFEQIIVITLDIGFGKKLEFVADELDALAVGAIHKHYVGFYTSAVAVINPVNELTHDGSFPRPRRPVKKILGMRFEAMK